MRDLTSQKYNIYPAPLTKSLLHSCSRSSPSAILFDESSSAPAWSSLRCCFNSKFRRKAFFTDEDWSLSSSTHSCNCSVAEDEDIRNSYTLQTRFFYDRTYFFITIRSFNFFWILLKVYLIIPKAREKLPKRGFNRANSHSEKCTKGLLHISKMWKVLNKTHGIVGRPV